MIDYNLPAILQPTYKLLLSPGRAVDVQVGDGFVMGSPIDPRPAIRPPFRAAATTLNGFDDAKNMSDLIRTESEVLYVTDVQTEYRLSTMTGSVGGIFGSISAAYAKAREEVTKNTIAYVFIDRIGEGQRIVSDQVRWDPAPDTEMLRGDTSFLRPRFIEQYGSHFVSAVFLGRRIVIRITTSDRQSVANDTFRAAVSAIAGGWNAKGTIAAQHVQYLSRAEQTLTTYILGGGISPDGRGMISGIEATVGFLSGLWAGDIVMKSGPLEVELASYFSTLNKFPKTQKIFEQSEVETLSTPHGVPVGTVVAWNPPLTVIQFSPDNQEIVTIRPPKGWVLCDGGSPNIPDLRDRFVMGWSGTGQPRDTGGSNVIRPGGDHTHTGQLEIPVDPNNGWPALGFAIVPDNPPMRRTYALAHYIPYTTPASGTHDHGGDQRPQYCALVYIMRAI